MTHNKHGPHSQRNIIFQDISRTNLPFGIFLTPACIAFITGHKLHHPKSSNAGFMSFGRLNTHLLLPSITFGLSVIIRSVYPQYIYARENLSLLHICFHYSTWHEFLTGYHQLYHYSHPNLTISFGLHLQFLIECFTKGMSHNVRWFCSKSWERLQS